MFLRAYLARGLAPSVSFFWWFRDKTLVIRGNDRGCLVNLWPHLSLKSLQSEIVAVDTKCCKVLRHFPFFFLMSMYFLSSWQVLFRASFQYLSQVISIFSYCHTNTIPASFPLLSCSLGGTPCSSYPCFPFCVVVSDVITLAFTCIRQSWILYISMGFN